MSNQNWVDNDGNCFLGDQDVAARVLAHVANRSTDLGMEEWLEPVANYRSVSRLEREIELLRRWPVALCPSAALPQRGSYRALKAAGTSLLLVRDEAGRARAFRNACRHRGTQLAAGEGCARSFVCPYHGWTYGLDGALRRVPHEYGFPALDKTQYGLSEVSCQERYGLIFVTQQAPAEQAATALDSLPELITPGQTLLSSEEIEVQANWKIYLESFIEGYHIRMLHRQSFYTYGFDNLNVVETVGANSRVTFPFRRILKLAEVAPQERRVEGRLTYVYHLFPNVLVTVLSRHTNVLLLEPVDLERTRVRVFMLANAKHGAAAGGDAERDAQFVTQTGAKEDVAVVEAIQRSLGSGANQSFTFGRFEAAIVHFHRNLRRLLGEPQDA